MTTLALLALAYVAAGLAAVAVLACFCWAASPHAEQPGCDLADGQGCFRIPHEKAR